MSDQLLDQICEIVRQTGSIVLSASADKEIKAKEGAANYVTKYDSKVQKYLVAELTRLLPEATFVGEEDGFSSHKISSGYTFIIDPIDGTTNFICEFMCSGICVGLAIHGTMEIGVVYNPFRDELFCARRGQGSYLNGSPLHVHNRPLNEGVVNIDIAPYNPELRERAFAVSTAISYHSMDIRDIGSAALGICYVACNRCVAYISHLLSTWDYAAASLILTEAGGVFTDLQGHALPLKAKTSLLASTETGLQQTLDLIHPVLFPN